MNGSCINIPTQTEAEQEVQGEGAGIIHDDTSRSECVCFDSNGPSNGFFGRTEIDFVVDVKFLGFPGYFLPSVLMSERKCSISISISISITWMQWVAPN